MKPTSHGKDWTGQKVGHLTILRFSHTRNGANLWEVQCECGKIKLIASGEFTRKLRMKHVGVCNAACKFASQGKRLKHGMCYSAEYKSWRLMLCRCYNPGNASYANYGGRGVTVCARWRKSFPNFIADLGRKSGPSMTLDRIDPEKNYTPSNCRWATKREQSNNRRDNVRIQTPNGEMTATEAARAAGILPSIVFHRIKAGYPADQLLKKPKKMNPIWKTQWGELTTIQACKEAGISPKLAWSRIAQGFTDPDRIFTSKDHRK